MKLGIVTINDFGNYGNRLQAYALQYFLRKLNNDIDVETIYFSKDKYILHNSIINSKFIRKYIFNRHGFRDSVNNNSAFYDIIKQYNMKKFTDKYIKTIYPYCIEKDINKKYDYFIIGSDQIWNPYVAEGDILFYKNINRDKRIAYAPSVGISSIPSNLVNIFNKMIKNTKCISVREVAGADIIEKITGNRPPVLVDPTLLLSTNDWDQIAEKPLWYNDSKKYIFVYYINDLPIQVKNELVKLSEKYNLEIVNLMDQSNFDIYVSSPGEFVWLIKNCEMVYTDSFHGTVFSIIMKKPFVVCPRENSGMDMNSRIDTLLDLFNLKNRVGYPKNGYKIDNPLYIEFKNIDSILFEEKKKAAMYLKSALNIK